MTAQVEVEVRRRYYKLETRSHEALCDRKEYRNKNMVFLLVNAEPVLRMVEVAIILVFMRGNMHQMRQGWEQLAKLSPSRRICLSLALHL